MKASLNARSREILSVLMAEFIQSGVPVASRRVAEISKSGLSSASIRSVLKELEDEGYLEQPHTSAGRVPTLSAFRLFVDSLMKRQGVGAKTQAKITEFFATADRTGPTSDTLRRAGRLLSELSGSPAIVVRRPERSRVLSTLRFIPTGEKQLLCVAVHQDGSVENRFLNLEFALPKVKLERLHHLIDEALGERSLEDLRAYIQEQEASARDENRQLHELTRSLLGAAGVEREDEVVIEGRSQVLRQLRDQRSAEQLLRVLDDRKALVELLSRTLSSNDVQVYLGGVADQEENSVLSVVAAPLAPPGLPESQGALGVVGSMVMDYPKLVPLVATMAKALSQALAPPLADDSQTENSPPENH